MNQITCPNCKRTITADPLIDAAARQDGSGAESIFCECGERLTYWAITAQLRKQETVGYRIQNWFRNAFQARG